MTVFNFCGAVPAAYDSAVIGNFNFDFPFFKVMFCIIKNGTVESIIDKETNLINGEYIDSVSDKIMDDFNQLSEIE